MITGLQLMDNAVTRTVSQFPYFAPGILRLKLEVDNNLPKDKPAATDGTRIIFREDFINHITPGQRMFVVLHEWYHIMFCHHVRRGIRDLETWRRATDYMINDHMKELPGVEFLPGVLYDTRFHDMTDYQIYDILIQEPEQEAKELSRGQQSFDSIEDHPSIPEGAESSPEKEQIEAEIQSQISEGLMVAKMAGTLPGSLEQLFAPLLEARIDWKSALANFIQVTVRDDFSYRIVNTRLSHTGFIFPSLWGEMIESLVFVGDTSCSISEKELKEYGTDLISAFESVNIQTLYVLWCDTRIANVQKFERGDVIELKPKGGGGTDFEPPFEWVAEQGLQPAGLVYLTDGECNSFAPEPEYPVLWCIYGGKRDFNPPYGEVLPVDFN